MFASYLWRSIGLFLLGCVLAARLGAQPPEASNPNPKPIPSQEPSREPSQATGPRPARSGLAAISSEEEEEVLAFVSTHNAPLRALLGDLKASRPVEYQRALLDLFRTTQRLAQVKRNRPHAYALEIQRWQAQSRVQMLTALLVMNGDAKTRAQLKEALEQRAEVQLQILKADREAAARRLEQLDEQIRQAEEGRQARVQQEFDRSLAAARRARGPRADSLRKRPGADNANSDGKPKDAADPPATEKKDPDRAAPAAKAPRK